MRLVAEGYGLAPGDPLLQASLTAKDANVRLVTIELQSDSFDRPLWLTAPLPSSHDPDVA